MEFLKKLSNGVKDFIENICEGQPAWKIILVTVITTEAIFWSKEVVFQDESLISRSKKRFLKLVRKIPAVQNKIENEKSKISSGLMKDINENINNDPYLLYLPEKGWTREEILKEATNYTKYGNFNWKEGYASGSVYNGGEDLTNLMTEIYGLSLWTNPLHSDVFPGIRKMEAEVVQMCCSMFNGSPESCGTMTTGGTESIVMACKAYRGYAKEVSKIKYPEMLVPITAHAAFDKAASLLNMGIKHVPVNQETLKVDVQAMRKMISKNTCMIVGSAPGFPHGVIDPIPEIASLGKKYNIPVHVDACLGGFLIAFAAEAGFSLPLFDFRLDGVTSISCDTHKYGFTPKGSSVILYSEQKYRHQQYFVQADWPGGIYATPSLSGSRPGGIIAASWASLVYHGKDGYVEWTRKIINTAKKIEKGCREIKGVYVMGYPEVSVVAIGSKDFNIYTLFDGMTKKGWNLNALQYPNCIHIAVTALHTKDGVADRFLKDVKDIATELIRNPPKEAGGSAAIYGLSQSLPDRSVVNEVAWCYIDSCYSTALNVNATQNGTRS